MVFAIFALIWIASGWISILLCANEYSNAIDRIELEDDKTKELSNFMGILLVSILGPIVFGLMTGVVVGVEGAAKGRYKSTKYPTKD